MRRIFNITTSTVYMFNVNFLISLMFLIIYIINLVVFTIFISKNTSTCYKNKIFNTQWTNFNKFSLILLLIVLAGLPPFSFFFFKIFIILNSKNVTLSVLVMCLVNVFILYYYINFISAMLWGNVSSVYNNKSKIFITYLKYSKLKFINCILYICVLTNLYFILFWDFLLNLMQII